MNEKNDIEELLNYSIYLFKKESIFRNKYIDFKHSITKKDFIEKIIYLILLRISFSKFLFFYYQLLWDFLQ